MTDLPTRAAPLDLEAILERHGKGVRGTHFDSLLALAAIPRLIAEVRALREQKQQLERIMADGCKEIADQHERADRLHAQLTEARREGMLEAAQIAEGSVLELPGRHLGDQWTHGMKQALATEIAQAIRSAAGAASKGE